MATMADVAARAGVSVATVSRALSGRETVVRGSTLARVRQAAEELGYHPNRLGRNMRSGSTRIIGLVIGDIGNPFFTAVARGVEDVAQANGYSLVLTNTDEAPAREAASLGILAAERASGIIVASTDQTTAAIRRVQAAGIQLVAIDRRISGARVDSVTLDNVRAAFEAAGHLLDLGHTRIALVGGLEGASTARDRLRGYRSAHEARHVAIDEALIQAGNFRESGGVAATERLLQLATRPTAILAVDHQATTGVMRTLRRAGLRIPADVSIVGFDDPPDGELLEPPLTVIEQPTYEIGATAAQLLLRRLAEPSLPVREVVLTGRLIVRSSTAAPANP